MDQKTKDALKKIFSKLGIKDIKMGSMKTSDGKEMMYEGDSPVVGVACTMDGQPCPDGEYTMGDCSTVSCKDGKIAAVKPKVEQDSDKELADMLEWLFGFKKTLLPGLELKFKTLGESTATEINS